MQQLAVVRRRDSNGNVRDAAVNAANVLYVFELEKGTYITFHEEHGSDSQGVTPIGLASPDSVEEVIRRLNQPYWRNVALRVGSFALSALAIILAILAD